MIKLAFFVSRHPELSRAQFRDHAESVYLPLLKQLPGLKRLVLNFRQSVEGPGQLEIDVMAELWFDSMATYQHAIHGSTQGEAVRKDRAGFFDETRSKWMLCEETSVF